MNENKTVFVIVRVKVIEKEYLTKMAKRRNIKLSTLIRQLLKLED